MELVPSFKAITAKLQDLENPQNSDSLVIRSSIFVTILMSNTPATPAENSPTKAFGKK